MEAVPLADLARGGGRGGGVLCMYEKRIKEPALSLSLSLALCEGPLDMKGLVAAVAPSLGAPLTPLAGCAAPPESLGSDALCGRLAAGGTATCTGCAVV